MDGRRPRMKPHKRVVNNDVAVRKIVRSEVLYGGWGEIWGLSSSDNADGRVV